MYLEEGKIELSPNSHELNKVLAELHNSRQRSKNGQIVFLKGKECFKEFYLRFQKIYKRKSLNTDRNSDSILKEAYEDFLEIYETDLKHYLKNFCQLLRFVDNSELENKKIYYDIIRAQLSAEEANLLFYHIWARIPDFEYTKIIKSMF